MSLKETQSNLVKLNLIESAITELCLHVVVPAREPCSCSHPNSNPPCSSCSNTPEEEVAMQYAADALGHIVSLRKYFQALEVLLKD